MTEEQLEVSSLSRLIADLANIVKLIERCTGIDRLESHSLERYLSNPDNSTVYWEERLDRLLLSLGGVVNEGKAIDHLSSVQVPIVAPDLVDSILKDLKIGVEVAQNSVELIQVLLYDQGAKEFREVLGELGGFYKNILSILNNHRVIH